MKTNSTLIVVLITLLVYFSILIIFLSRHNYNPGTLIHLGSKFIENTYVDPKLPVNYEYGYDGQFYYRLALEPSYRDSSLGPHLDSPAYRMQRIFYPLLVHILSFGKRNIVPVNLIIVNILFLCFIALAGSKLSESGGSSPYYGLAFSLYPGFVFSLIVDTPEAVFTGLILLSLTTIRFQKHLLTTLFLTMAVLTRETTLIMVLSILLTLILQTLFQNSISDFKLKWHNAIIPLVVFLLWQTYIFFRWGHLSFSEGYGNLGIPFAGFLTSYLNLIKSAERSSWIDAMLLSGYLISGITALILVIPSRALVHEKIMFIAYASFSTLFSAPIYEYRGGFLRVFSEFYATAILILLGYPNRITKIIILLWGFCFAVIAWLYSFIH